MRPPDPQFSKWLVVAVAVASLLVREGQGGGCHTVRALDPSAGETGDLLLVASAPLAPSPGLPLSLAFPHKGGGSAGCAGLAADIIEGAH